MHSAKSRARSPLLAALALVALAGSLAAQVRPRTRPAPSPQSPVPAVAQWDSAYYAWDAGRYDEALERMLRLLAAPDGAPFLDSVALLTGERFTTTALADSATRAHWSADGRYLALEWFGGGRPAAGTTPPAPFTRIYRREGDGLVPVLRLSGVPSAFLGRSGRVAALVRGEGGAVVTYRDLATGASGTLPTGDLRFTGVFDGGDGVHVLLTVLTEGGGGTTLVLVDQEGRTREVAGGAGSKAPLFWARGGAMLVYRTAGGFSVWDRATGTSQAFIGGVPSLSANDSQVVFVGRAQGENALYLLTIGQPTPQVVRRTTDLLDSPALDPHGRRIVYARRSRDDWNLWVVNADGSDDRRLTATIQNDGQPQFLADGRVLAKVGESRHRRSYLYDLDAGTRTRFFHNNTVRTMAMEYQWAPGPDGQQVVILAHRDGNTLNRANAAWVVDRTRPVTGAELDARLRTMLAGERDLRERARRLTAPRAAEIRAAVADVSARRVQRAALDLEALGPRSVTQPYHALAVEYLIARLRSYGYEPEVQWVEARSGNRAPVRTANVVATLRGTAHPELVVVASAHTDSEVDGPGAEDNGSGTVMLLETARVLARRPQPSTIQFAFVTAEEIGMFGSREFVRRAQADSVRIVANLNNDTFGWSHDGRLNAAIRYSNAGIRDLQHAAALQFTNLITYDAVRFQSSDGLSFWQGYGDIVGGIGSYPMLASPHYHETHDLTETVNYTLVAEVAKTTVASLMLLASGPDPLRNVRAVPGGP